MKRDVYTYTSEMRSLIRRVLVPRAASRTVEDFFREVQASEFPDSTRSSRERCEFTLFTYDFTSCRDPCSNFLPFVKFWAFDACRLFQMIIQYGLSTASTSLRNVPRS